MKFFAIVLVLALTCAAAGLDTEKSKSMGSLVAPIRLDLYSDFTCPHCKLFHDQILQKLVEDFVTPGKAYLVFHEYVLQGPGHEHSRDAANYAAAAARIGKYAQVSAALFASQASWAVSGKVWDAVSPVLTPTERTRIQTLVKEPSLSAEVQHDVDMANSSHVDRTPTLIISPRGKKSTHWTYWGDYPLFRSFMYDQLK